MSSALFIAHDFASPARQPVEIIERKGLGHPDTLADLLAEHLSVTYSRYTQSRFGIILRHQFDKTTLMCGQTEVRFGGGRMVSPIRIILNGRASPRLGTEEIPIFDILPEACRRFFAPRFPMLHSLNDFKIMLEVGHSTTGGIHGDQNANSAPVHYRFNPRSLDDIPESRALLCNDTSMGCAFAPYTPLESLVLTIEGTLNSPAYKSQNPWAGSDIKIMAHRLHDHVHVTMAAPIISGFTPDYPAYLAKLYQLEADVAQICRAHQFTFTLTLNAGDSIDDYKIYMNWTGSSIEAGDEGQVGRGNRLGGLIAPMRPYTMEGICGKNPVYHTGKVYSALAYDIAWSIHRRFRVAAEVFIAGQMGRPLCDPWKVFIRTESEVDNEAISNICFDHFSSIPSTTERLLDGLYPLC